MLFSSLLAAAISGQVAFGCVTPKGFGTGAGELEFSSFAFPSDAPQAGPNDPPNFGIFGTALGPAVAMQGTGLLETPIAAFTVLRADASIFNSMATFEEKALDMFARPEFINPLRRCLDGDADLLDQYRKVTLAYTSLWGIAEAIPNTGVHAMVVAEAWNLDLTICDEGTAFDCSDPATPWGLAKLMVDDATDIMSRGGWNQDGSRSAEYNRVPFSDWRAKPYQPKMGSKYSWKPLLEHNKLGFAFRQEHVTSHIGFTAKSFFVGDEKICDRQLTKPRIKYKREMKEVLKATGTLTDEKKAEVELFDNKLTSLFPMQIQYTLRTGMSLDSWEFIVMDAVTIAALYEGVIAVWRDKVRFDLIRPTTLIQQKYKGKTVLSYLGPDDKETGFIDGSEWQPYKRVMPHSEFPSGSSCLCRAFARSMIEWTGIDDIAEELGGPLVLVAEAGSSTVEMGKPEEAVTLAYDTWSQVADACGQSRLNAGLHFVPAVPAGDTLCEPIGDDVVNHFRAVMAGEEPSFKADTDSEPSDGRFCDQ